MNVTITLSPVTKHFPVTINRYRSHVTASSQVTRDTLMDGGDF